MKINQRHFCNIVLFCISLSIQAQSELNSEMLPPAIYPIESHINQFPGSDDTANASACSGCFSGIKFILPFDSRFSLATDPIKGNTEIVKIFGFKIGLEFFEKYRFGVGFYEQKHPIHSQLINPYHDTVSYSIGFRYNTVYFEYVWHEDFRWEISTPLQLGIAGIPVSTFSSVLDSVTLDTSFSVPVASIGVGAHYKFIPWFGIGAGLGYRRILLKDEVVNKTFSKPFVSFKLKLFIGPLYKCIFKPDVIKAQREQYNRMRRKKQQDRDQRRENKRRHEN